MRLSLERYFPRHSRFSHGWKVNKKPLRSSFSRITRLFIFFVAQKVRARRAILLMVYNAPMRVILLLVMSCLALAAQAYDPDAVSRKLNPPVPFSLAEKRAAANKLQSLIDASRACRSDDDCVNIIANCFGCTVAVHQGALDSIYEQLGLYHTRYGQCKIACPVGAAPARCISAICQNIY